MQPGSISGGGVMPQVDGRTDLLGGGDPSDYAPLPMGIEQSMVDYYARRAAEFERVYEKPERQHDLAALRKAIEAFFVGTDGIEIACGTGYWTQYAARQANSWLATDINEEVLSIARAKPLDPRRVRLAMADSYALPSPDRCFTGGLAAFWWSHVPKGRLAEFVRRFHQSLAPGARVWIMDNRFVAGSSSEVSRIDAEGNGYQWRTLADGSRFEVMKNFPDEEELRGRVAGEAEEVRVEWLEYYWVLTYRLAGRAPKIWTGSTLTGL